MQKVLIWDVPTRIGHWLLVMAFALTFISGDSEQWRLFHVSGGYAIGGILLFRIFWGIVGTRYARFKSFLFSPSEVFSYLAGLLKGKPAHWLGHNPAGSYAIYVLLILGFATVATGVAAYAEIGGNLVEDAHDVLSYSMLGVVGFHILGVIVSSFAHQENLIRSMINGCKMGRSQDAIESGKTYWAIGPVASALLAGLLVFVS